jgi:hypothetical protein
LVNMPTRSHLRPVLRSGTVRLARFRFQPFDRLTASLVLREKAARLATLPPV